MNDSSNPEAGAPLTGVVRKPRIFYGWWIVLAGAFGAGLSSGLSFHGFGAFLPALEREFGWSRTAMSGVFSLARVESGLLGPIEGVLVDRLGPRRMMLIGIPLMGIGFILLSRVNSLPMFYLVFILGVTLGSSIGFGYPITTSVANWFKRKRGRAIGFQWTGHGFGGLLVPILSALIVGGVLAPNLLGRELFSLTVPTLGWRTTAILAGLLVFILGPPIAFVLRHRPEPYGYLPDGDTPEDARSHSEALARSTESLTEDFSARDALKTRAFWLIAISQALRQAVTGGMSVHFILFLTDNGITETTAAALFGLEAIMTNPGRLGLAWLGDAVDKRRLMTVSMGIMGVSVFLMGQTVLNLAFFIPFMLVYAVSWGGMSSMIVPLRADYFGRRNFATIQGFMSMVQMVGMVTGPLLTGVVVDVTGSYELAFQGFLIASLLGAVAIYLARPPAKAPGARPSPSTTSR